MGRPVELVWRKRTWRCEDPDCPGGAFTEREDDLARPRALLTTRACWWAIGQMRREHASVQGLARQFGTAWRTVWRAIKPLLEALAADESRFAGVSTLGVDELRTEGADRHARPHPRRQRPGASAAARLGAWPHRRGLPRLARRPQRGVRTGITVATLDPFHGYKNAIDDQLDDAVAVLDAFHIVKLGTDALDQCRRRLQQDIHGHRGRESDPLYGIRLILRCGQERLTDKKRARLDKAMAADERHDEVHIAWQCAQQLRSAYTATSLAEERQLAPVMNAWRRVCGPMGLSTLARRATRRGDPAGAGGPSAAHLGAGKSVHPCARRWRARSRGRCVGRGDGDDLPALAKHRQGAAAGFDSEGVDVGAEASEIRRPLIASSEISASSFGTIAHKTCGWQPSPVVSR